jgi:hypothetical protein
LKVEQSFGTLQRNTGKPGGDFKVGFVQGEQLSVSVPCNSF